jgi:IS5 family transposase
VPEDQLLRVTVAELDRLGLRPAEAAFDAGFTVRATRAAMGGLGTEAFIVGSATNGGSRRTRRRLARYRVGCEGRIAHLKREYGARQSRLRGAASAAIWLNGVVLAYDIDTAAALPLRRGR